ncbi:hypothetical protein [Streptosporangium carneum]|uniref:Uncharacterized protein n=1 Tax=Streptosporangium carneum TaxID=47481 RepID=A0A9W6I166_9ACTN|nr:hypothetical protein [Streptosporangium carneum]GLK09787.1 hypothetical protein GCM10017600_31930 [Streptosporangium carneum]
MTPDGDYGVPGSLAKVLADVAAERVAQDVMWGIQDIDDGTGPWHAADADRAKEDVGEASREGRLTWRHILREEVLEAFAEDGPDALRTELVQVAAVAVKWVQALDRRGGTLPVAGGRPFAPHALKVTAEEAEDAAEEAEDAAAGRAEDGAGDVAGEGR